MVRSKCGLKGSIVLFVLAISSCLWAPWAPDDVVIHVPGRQSGAGAEGAQKPASMKLYLGLWQREKNDDAGAFVRDLSAFLQFDEMFHVEQEILPVAPTTQDEVTRLFGRGFDAALFVEYGGLEKPVEWRLYDTQKGTMVCGRRLTVHGGERETALCVAEMVVRSLLGETPPFLTKIAFVEKPIGSRGGATLCMVDIDGKNIQRVFKSRRPIVSPIWTPDTKNPFLIVSQFTYKNVSFVGVDLAGRSYPLKIFSKSKDGKSAQYGTYVGLSYGKSMSEVAFGRSGKIWRYSRERGAEPLDTGASLVCASPNLLPSGDIIYCADNKIKYYDCRSKNSRTLVGDGYCINPAYSPVSKQVVFSKRIRRVMQLCLGDVATGSVRQLTYDKGDKVDPCWSPCGKYVVFCWEQGRQSRLGIWSMRISRYELITPPNLCCSSPAWSPWFEQGFPRLICSTKA